MESELRDGSTKERNTGFVTPTQLFLNFMTAAGGKQKRDELLVSLYDIKHILSQHNIQTDVVFRGNRKEGVLFSESISSELWYWESNEFIEEQSDYIIYSAEKGKIRFTQAKIDEKINWNLSQTVKDALKQAINTVIIKKVTD